MNMYKKIKELRISKGMSQDDLASLTGYTSRSSIAKIEAGEVDLPQSKIQAFADALHTTPQFLMGWEEDVKFENMIDPRFNDFKFALMHGENDLTEDQKQDLLDFYEYIKTKKK